MINWMNGIIFLVGLVLGGEIMYCVLKYRRDAVADKINELHGDLSDLLRQNRTVINEWGKMLTLTEDVIKFNGELCEHLELAEERRTEE